VLPRFDYRHTGCFDFGEPLISALQLRALAIVREAGEFISRTPKLSQNPLAHRSRWNHVQNFRAERGRDGTHLLLVGPQIGWVVRISFKFSQYRWSSLAERDDVNSRWFFALDLLGKVSIEPRLVRCELNVCLHSIYPWAVGEKQLYLPNALNMDR
jgi:hypothetical protein